MARAKHGTMALAGLKSGAITREATRVGLPVHILASHKADPRLLLRLIRLIRSEGYAILDSQNIQSKFWSNIAALITKTVLVSTLNSWYANEHGKASLKGKIYTALELSTNQSLGLYITVSEKDRQSLLKSGVSEDDVELIYNAVDLDISAIPGDKDWLIKEFSLPPRSIVCTAVGRLVPIKGYDVLIDAIQKIASQISELHCLIIGEGESKVELYEQIKRAGMENRISLVGYLEREKAMSVLKSSDIFAMPSRYEGTPIALLEAAALALPIIASSSGGIPELVTHGEHALLVPPEDSLALAQGLLKLTRERTYAEKLGQNAQKRIQKNFNLESQASATWNAYQKALTSRNAREK